MTYTYSLSGAMIEQKYPSGRVVKNTLSSDGDLQQVQSQKSGGTLQNYANAFNFNAAGAVTSMRLGNGKFESTQFNSRLQPTQIGLGGSATNTSLLKLNYDYGTTDNNGNVKSQTITVPTVGSNQGFVATQNYTYDSLNRLKSAIENITGQTPPSWKQTYTFDRYGNRRFDEANTIPPGCAEAVCNPQINPATNKLIGYQFDSAGNTKVDANGQTFTYDSENKQVKVQNGTQTVGEYIYDGDGRRVKKVVPNGETTIFVYDAGGKTVAEYSTVVASSQDAKVSYLTNDHLGSPRITTDSVGQVISRRDFRPYGEDITRANYGSDAVRQKFTGYERDGETNLDFAQARYQNFNLGRFTSPDDFFNDTELTAPASWNLYVYVRNNPLKYVDPDGEQILIKYVDDDGNAQTVQYLNGKLYTGTFNKQGQFVRGDEYTGTNQYALDAMNYLNELRTDKESDLGARISTLEKSKQVHTIMQDPDNPDRDEAVPLSREAAKKGLPTGSTIYWSGKESTVTPWDSAPGFSVPAYASLTHELLAHGYDLDQGLERLNNVYLPVESNSGYPEFILVGDRELNAVAVENDARAFGSAEPRRWYGKYKLPELKPVLKPSPRRPRRK